MIEHFKFNEEWLSNLLDSIVFEEVEPMGPYKASVLRATGMTIDELDEFLNTRCIHHSSVRISALAIDELKDWYVGKMRRYVRNAVALEVEVGSEEDILFYEFCSKYRKSGHQDVKSWEDIDEAKLLFDFEEECYELYYPLIPIKNKGGLLDRIHRSFIFHLRLKKTTKHSLSQVNIIISIILCNRYHIFTTEADANAGTTKNVARGLINKWFNPPRHVILYGLAS